MGGVSPVQKFQLKDARAQQDQTAMFEIQANRQREQMNRFKIMQETEKKIREDHSQIALDFFKSSNKMADGWSQAAGG